MTFAHYSLSLSLSLFSPSLSLTVQWNVRFLLQVAQDKRSGEGEGGVCVRASMLCRDCVPFMVKLDVTCQIRLNMALERLAVKCCNQQPGCPSYNCLTLGSRVVDVQRTYAANCKAYDKVPPGFSQDAINKNAAQAHGNFKHFVKSQAGQRLAYHDTFFLYFQPIGVALGNWNTLDKGYISLVTGNLVVLCGIEEGGWALGIVDGNAGWFPASWVRWTQDPPSIGFALACFDATSYGREYITLTKQDLVHVLFIDENQWAYGFSKGRYGWFPATFYQRVSWTGVARARFDGTRHDGCITLRPNAPVHVIDTDGKQWAYGCSNGSCGWFPADHCIRMSFGVCP